MGSELLMVTLVTLHRVNTSFSVVITTSDPRLEPDVTDLSTTPASN